jgi:hypothetical protein
VLIDDRWDALPDLYRDFPGARRDLREVRDDSYRRTDGTWGGGLRRIREWSPTLLVTPTHDIDGIRRISMSPQWRVMGLDARRAIFGRSDESRNAAQLQRALATLTSLEWPGANFGGVDPRVLVVSSSDDARPVANALCAMRLPYAALRILPEQQDPATEAIRAWCYLELAHRVRHHSGRASLLDQHRALCRVRDLLSEASPPLDDVLKIAGSLEGLGLDYLAHQCAERVLSLTDSSDVPRAIHEHAGAIQRRAASPSDEAGTVDETASDGPEQAMRAALEHGDAEACRRTLPQLDPLIRDYYAALAAAGAQTPTAVSDQLAAALDQAEFPDRLRGEASFYLGCLRIETGEGVEAIAALAAIDPDSPYTALQQLYLAQLRRH